MIIICLKCFIHISTFNFISFKNYFLFDFRATVSSSCVEFDLRSTLFKLLWFLISIWIMVVFDLFSFTMLLFYCWRSSINSLFCYGLDWLSIRERFFIRYNCSFRNILIAFSSAVMSWVFRIKFSVPLIVVTFIFLLRHSSNVGVSGELGAEGGSVRWLPSLTLYYELTPLDSLFSSFFYSTSHFSFSVNRFLSIFISSSFLISESFL